MTSQSDTTETKEAFPKQKQVSQYFIRSANDLSEWPDWRKGAIRRANTGVKIASRTANEDDETAESSRRLVLVGLTGAGKSSSGNTILGREAFRVAKSATSVTKECAKQTENVGGREITVVDTPGLFDTEGDDEILAHKISKCINMTAPGPHAIVLVIQPGPFEDEEKLLVEKISAIFGEEADKHTIILFTHGDKHGRSFKKQIKKAGEGLKEVLERCGNRYHVFNNKDMEDRNQVLDFLDKVDALVAANGDTFYTSEYYEDVKRELTDKEKKLKEEIDKKLQVIKKDLESKFNNEKEKLEERFNEFKRYYETEIRDARQEAEQTHIHQKKLKKILRNLQKLTI